MYQLERGVADLVVVTGAIGDGGAGCRFGPDEHSAVLRFQWCALNETARTIFSVFFFLHFSSSLSLSALCFYVSHINIVYYSP